jgi:hypothetical protein
VCWRIQSHDVLCALRLALVVSVSTCGLGGCVTRVHIGDVSPKSGQGGSSEPERDAQVEERDAAALDARVEERDAAVAHASTEMDSSLPPEPLPKVTWPTGVHAGQDVQKFLNFGKWRGRSIDLAHVFPDRLQGWDGIVNPAWPVDMFNSFPGKLIMSLPLYPEGQGNNKDCAAGMYNAQWRRLGTFLVARNRPDSIVRLGWGPNDGDHAWRADANPSDWKSCFRNAVRSMRETDPKVLIDWSFNPIGAPNVLLTDPFLTYPDDDVVDFIGIEAFDRYPVCATLAAWDEQCSAPTGLCTVIDFTRQHGKKLGIAEWGVASCGGESGGDSAFFIERIVRTFAANADIMGYEAYFDDTEELCSAISDEKVNPNAAAKYKEIYSAR